MVKIRLRRMGAKKAPPALQSGGKGRFRGEEETVLR